jgi:hypothetical protein
LRKQEVTHVQGAHVSEADWRGISHVVFCIGAEDAQSFVSRYRSSFPDLGRLLFFYVGNSTDKQRVMGLTAQIRNRKIILVTPDDLLGSVMAIKIAIWLKQQDVWLTYLDDGLVEIIYRNKTYLFPVVKISLSAFEKAAGLRLKIRCYRIRH